MHFDVSSWLRAQKKKPEPEKEKCTAVTGCDGGNASDMCKPRQADSVGYILITHLRLGEERVQGEAEQPLNPSLALLILSASVSCRL